MTTATTPAPDTDLSARWSYWDEEGLPGDLEQRLPTTGVYSPEAVTTISSLASELEARLATATAVLAVDRFLAAADGFNDSCDRRATVRVLERLSQLRAPALPWITGPHPDAHTRRRVLTPAEYGLVRHCSQSSRLRAGIIGALDSGAVSGELGCLTPPLFTLDTTGSAEAVALPGTTRSIKSGYTEAAPRTNPVAAWVRRTLGALATAAPTDAQILYTGGSQDPDRIQSSILMGVNAVLTDAGLAQDPTVKPLSIRNTAARAHYDATGDLVATAEFLGHDDLMTVAREIGLRSHRPLRRR